MWAGERLVREQPVVFCNDAAISLTRICNRCACRVELELEL